MPSKSQVLALPHHSSTEPLEIERPEADEVGEGVVHLAPVRNEGLPFRRGVRGPHQYTLLGSSCDACM